MRSLGNGRYAADLGVRPPGTYTFTAAATSGGAALGDDRGSFGVGRLAAEFREPGADPALMRQLATRSGGLVVGLDTLGAFVAGLRDRGDLADRPLVREDETPLLDLWPLLALGAGAADRRVGLAQAPGHGVATARRPRCPRRPPVGTRRAASARRTPTRWRTAAASRPGARWTRPQPSRPSPRIARPTRSHRTAPASWSHEK